MNKITWETLTSIDQLNSIDEQSKESPVVIFKHSTRCAISATAKGRLERKWDQSQHPKVQIYYLDLIAHRDISNEIAERYGIEHESPQVLIIENGSCTYHDSHLGVSYDSILEKILPVSI